MDTTAILIIVLAVAMIVAPFAALRAAAHLRSRKIKQTSIARDGDRENDKSEGYW